jgi:branched-chain amino acid transport system substrate-binding protein
MARMSFMKPRILITAFFLASLAGCATTEQAPVSGSRRGQPRQTNTGSQPPSLGPNTSSEDLRGRQGKEAQMYRSIYDMYLKGMYETAIPDLMGFERRYPGSPLISQVRNLHGLCLLLTRRPQAAAQQFQVAIKSEKTNTVFAQYVTYNLAAAQFEAGQIEDALQSAGSIQMDAIDKDNQIKLHHLKARILLKKNLPLESARESLLTSRLLSDIQLRDPGAPFARTLQIALQNITNAASLESLYGEFEDSHLADQLLFRLGSREIAEGNVGGAELHLRLMMSRFPDSPLYAQATELLNNAQAQNKVDSGAIGVLLPLKGKFAPFGQRSLNSIELAFRIFNQNEPDPKITLVVEDSGEDAEQAVRALDRLVYKHHVVAVIGPLLSKGIDQVTIRAQELGVPLVSLTRYTGVPSDYVFQAGLTLKMQAYEIARAAVERFGMKRFAMMYPNDKVGREIGEHFWDAVEAMGGEVVGSESYMPGETDFRTPIDRLIGTHYAESRGRELEALAKERQQQKIKKKTRKTEKFFNLKPIVDFDAVFIPDEPKIAGQVFPTFNYRDVDGVKFLGTAAWDSPEFLQRVQSYGENTLFLDAFFAGSNSGLSRKFVEKYRASFGTDPIAVDALAFDAAGIVEEALKDAGSSASRADVRNRLKQVSGFRGITGKIGYKDGQFLRDLKVLTVRSGQITEID